MGSVTDCALLENGFNEDAIAGLSFHVPSKWTNWMLDGKRSCFGEKRFWSGVTVSLVGR
jgi:hypothetical protein